MEIFHSTYRKLFNKNANKIVNKDRANKTQ
jgi:hypothetical protein